MPLPGSTLKLNDTSNELCDDCEEPNAAEFRVQGETDSFGCEYLFLCSRHYDEFKIEVDENPIACELCTQPATPQRDLDEGLNGPVHYRCQDHRL